MARPGPEETRPAEGDPVVDRETANAALAASALLYQSESDRTTQLDQKASILLAAVGVVLTLFLTVGSDAVRELAHVPRARELLIGSALAFGVSFVCAFAALMVRRFRQPRLSELLAPSALLLPPAEYAWTLAVTYEEAVRLNSAQNEWKVLCIKIALWCGLVALLLVSVLMVYYTVYPKSTPGVVVTR